MSAPSGAPPGWYDDPTRRHARRYFDGSIWTEHVVEASGAQAVDPLQASPATATSPSQSDPRFAQVAAQWAAYRAQVDAGQMPVEQLDQTVSGLVFESGGRFWMIGSNSGEWYVSQGQTWVRATPPGGP